MATKGNPKLRAMLYKAAFRREEGDQTIADIANEYGLIVSATYNHVKKHMNEAKPMAPIMAAKRIEEVKMAVQKKLEVSFDHEDVVPKQDFELALDTIIQSGLSRLNASTSEVTINQLLAASKIKADYFGKRRGQDVEVIKTMYRTMNGTPSEVNEVPASAA